MIEFSAYRLLLLGLLLNLYLSGLASGAPNELPPQKSIKSFKGFSNLRKELLQIIGSAKSRVWLVTNFLTDGEVVSAIYISKYRKLDVRVLLGKAKSRTYMSRLGYLKKQNVPVSLRPRSFPLNSPSLLLVDQKLHIIDGNINFLLRDTLFSIRTAEPATLKAFVAAMKETRKNPISAVPPPVPLVGKAGHNNGRAIATLRPQANSVPAGDGTYNYDAFPPQRSAPAGIQRRLPRTPIYQRQNKNGPPKRVYKRKRTPFYLLNPVTAREPVNVNPRSLESR